jgi:hypothetical protein
MKKNILLMPTTDHTTKSFYYSYKDLIADYNFYFILDNKNIKGNYDYKEIKEINFSSLSQYKHLTSLKKPFAFWVNSLYVKYKALEVLEKYKIDCIIVSNDCPMPQSIFIQEAKKRGIKVISHQLASGITNPNLKKSLKSKILNFLAGNTSCKKFGSNSDLVWLMGNKWEHITDNPNRAIATNGYYYYFDQIYKDNVDLAKVNFLKKEHEEIKIVFYSSPFYEINLLSKEDTIKIYKALNKIALNLKDNYKLFFKPHPQEKLYKTIDFDKNIFFLDSLTSEECIEFADIGLSVGSSMSLQTKLLKKKSFGYWPNTLPEHYKENSKVFFDSIFKNADDFIQLLLNKKEKEISNIDDYFYISESPVINIGRLIKEALNAN